MTSYGRLSKPIALGVALVALLGVDAPGEALPVNLVQNGSFETPVIGAPFLSNAIPDGWTFAGSPGDAHIWRVGYVDSGGSVTVAGDGQQFVTLGGGFAATGSASWSQTINGLSPGLYDLTFDIAGETTFFPQSLTVSFPAGSDTPAQTFNAPLSSANYWRSWTPEFVVVDVTGASLTLQFSVTNLFEDIGLDAVSLTARGAVAAPEPGTFLLVGSGLVGLLVWGRYRRG